MIPEPVAAVSVGTLRAFLDETGIHAGARWCAIAGFLGSPRQWIDFDQAWRRALTAAPGASDFHAHEFFGGRSPYRALLGSERRAFIDGLIGAVVDHRVFPFGAIVDAEAFMALSLGERRMLTGASRTETRWKSSGAPSQPYYLAFEHCISIAPLRLARPGKVVDFFFDRQRSLAPWAIERFMEIKERRADLGPMLGTCAFAARGGVAPLQAADLLAYCWHHCAAMDLATRAVAPAERARAFKENERWRVLCGLTTRGMDDLELVDRESMDRLLAKFPDRVRKKLKE